MRLSWDGVGERIYETGVDHGVLYLPTNGIYDNGVAWNGLTTVTETPSGAEANPQYADNIKYLNLISAEEFGGTIEAFTYPPEFAQFDGQAVFGGASIGQQARRSFGLSYRTRIGNDVEGDSYGYKLHLIWGAQAAPSERAYATVNDSPEAMTMSWEISTTPVEVGEIDGVQYRPTASLTVDSTKTSKEAMDTLEALLYGTSSSNPMLPLPAAVIDIVGGELSVVTPAPATFDADTDEVTVPNTFGVNYQVNGLVVATPQTFVIDSSTTITAHANSGFELDPVAPATWTFTP